MAHRVQYTVVFSLPFLGTAPHQMKTSSPSVSTTYPHTVPAYAPLFSLGRQQLRTTSYNVIPSLSQFDKKTERAPNALVNYAHVIAAHSTTVASCTVLLCVPWCFPFVKLHCEFQSNYFSTHSRHQRYLRVAGPFPFLPVPSQPNCRQLVGPNQRQK